MPKRIFIKDGGLTASKPTPTGFTVIGADNGIPKKQIESTISDLGGFTHYIGEYFEGGVIFALWKGDGITNTNEIVNQSGHTDSAAKLCLDSTNGGYTDWYLPAIDELYLMRINRFYINQTLNNVLGSTPLPKGDSDYGWLWSSTEFSGQPSFAWYVDYYDGNTYDLSKSSTFKTVVRAVRRF